MRGANYLFRISCCRISKTKEYLVQEVGYKPKEIGIITGATSKPNRLKDSRMILIQENKSSYRE